MSSKPDAQASPAAQMALNLPKAGRSRAIRGSCARPESPNVHRSFQRKLCGHRRLGRQPAWRAGQRHRQAARWDSHVGS